MEFNRPPNTPRLMPRHVHSHDESWPADSSPPHDSSVGSSLDNEHMSAADNTATRRLLNDFDRRRRPVWKDRTRIRPRDYTLLRVFLLDVNQTPGFESSRRLTRISARVWHEFKLTLLSEHVNCLLILLPLSIIANLSSWDPILTFALNYLAIIPLVSLVSYATQEESFGKLPHAIFCNAAELIAIFLLLREGRIKLLNSFVLGSLANNLLLVCGTAMFLGGITNMTDGRGRGSQQVVSPSVTSSSASLLYLFVALIILEAAPYLPIVAPVLHIDSVDQWIAATSRSASVVLIIVYLLYLRFSIGTHGNLFDLERASLSDFESLDESEVLEGRLIKVNPRTAVVILCSSLLLLVFCIAHLITGFAAVERAHNVTDDSMGFVLIPLACSGAKHGIAVDRATKDRMSLAFAMALEPSVQLAIFLMPLAVLVGWITGDGVYLQFDLFETITVLLAVMVVSSCITGGLTDYLKGAMIYGVYVVIIIAMYVQALQDVA